MLGGDDPALWCALSQLMATYWADVDQNNGLQAHEFYLPEGIFVIGNNWFEGREKIEAFYARRRYSAVKTRHLLSNLRAFGDTTSIARTVGVMSLYRADGKSPFQGARPPAMIADFDARCVLCDDQCWRFHSHVLRPFIVGNDMPASIVINPRNL